MHPVAVIEFRWDGMPGFVHTNMYMVAGGTRISMVHLTEPRWVVFIELFHEVPDTDRINAATGDT